MQINQFFKFDEFMARRAMSSENCELTKILADLYHDYDINLGLADSGPWVAGGCLVQTLTAQPIANDIDFFFKGIHQYESIKSKLDDNRAKQTEESKSSVTYEVDAAGKSRKIQLINRNYYDNLAEVIDSFDLTVCQFGLAQNILLCGPFSQVDLSMRILKVNRTTTPHTTALRMLKYVSRGFRIMPGDFEQLNKDAMDLFAKTGLLKHEIDPKDLGNFYDS